MQTTVLLIVPPEKEPIDIKQAGSKWPRIGIAYIAAFLRKNDIDTKPIL